MPTKSKRSKPKHNQSVGEEIVDKPPVIEPYTVLGLERSATTNQIKSAYRKAALKHHPVRDISHTNTTLKDKVPQEKKEEAHTKFQEIAFAYAILIDTDRRKRYDLTGSTTESLLLDRDDDNFSWSTFFQEQLKEAVTEDAIQKFSQAYKNSSEERCDLITAYTESKGKWSHIYEVVMLSDPLEDEDRFKAILDQAIRDGEIEGYRSYTNESAKAKKRRLDARLKEKEELAEVAHAAGAEILLKSRPGADEDFNLKALIQRNKVARSSFLDHLEAKYTRPKVKNASSREKGSKNKSTENFDASQDGEPSDEAFMAAQKRLGQQKDGEVKKKRRKISN